MKSFGAQNMVSTLKKVLMRKPEYDFSKIDLKKWHYEKTLNQEIVKQNYKDFNKIIRDFGTEVIELSIRSKDEELCDSIFTHDPSLVTEDGAIILNMGKKLRKTETIEHENFYNQYEIPIIGKISEKGTVEGGDCLWVNKNTLLIGQSSRTNEEGIKQLSNILSRLNVECIPIKLPQYTNSESCFHLMSLMSMLDHDLVIGCISLLPQILKDEFKKRNIKLICIPEDEYKISNTLAINILALSPRKLVLIDGYPKTQELLLNEGNEIVLFEGKELCIKTEGGPTCLTRPILRD
ncbi:MAG: N(G),N(G)-dimethylarginine dimethylaminohydrolase [Alphaproteobacteria bacterium MarineAlpha5_Bin9]|nr:MAG: N(G),N(G)-dimethylarginine dimethylaminohydrolase [Alphaproteobacteria bacterium MarineAlpha5_Bin9]|tara:strand:- start:5688 stop:6566 length:879 start_codon:yes stop_codon:yes gene_type:complete